jgi:hypothetical protein
MLLAAADVLAMPSEHEGFGVAAESFCAGTDRLPRAGPALGGGLQHREHRRAASVGMEGTARAVAERRLDNDWPVIRRRDAEQARRRFYPERGVTEWRRLYELAAGTRT